MIVRARETLAWAWLRERDLIRWLFFVGWLAFGMRLFLTTRATLVGTLDDAAFVLLFTTVLTSLGALERGSRIFLQTAIGLILIAAILADTLHFRFFGSFVTFETILVANHVDEAGDSVAEMFSHEVIAFGVVVPLGFLWTAAWGERRRIARRLGRVPLVLLGAGAVTSLLSTAWLGELTAPPFNNPVLLFARQSLAAPDDEEIHAELQADEGRVFGLPAPGYEFEGNAEAPLVQVPTTDTEAASGRSRPNVLIVLMESVRAHEGSWGRGERSVTPHLDALARDAYSATNFYAVGHQTVRGEVAVLCSTYTHFGGAPIYIRYPSMQLACLPQILRDEGWSTWWLSSFRRDYFKKEAFLTAHGIDRMDDMRGQPVRRRLGWGASDEEMVEHAVSVLDGAPKPFFAEIMTLSNHDPFNHGYPIARPDADANDPQRYRDYLHGVAYTDHSVAHLLEVARSHDWFDNTIVVITSDHGARVFPAALDRESEQAREVDVFHRVPLIMTGPGVPRRTEDAVASQVDIAPTILDLVGVRARQAFMGRSLLAEIPAGDRLAVFSTANAWHIRQGDRYCYSVGTQCVEDGFPPCGSASEEPATHACFQTNGDLIDLTQAIGGAQLLPQAQMRELQQRGERVVRFTRHLIRTDSLYTTEPSE